MDITFHNTNDEILHFPLHYSIRKRLTHMTSQECLSEKHTQGRYTSSSRKNKQKVNTVPIKEKYPFH